MPELWPFDPDGQFSETLRWLSDVISTDSDEMCYFLDEVRQSVRYTHILSATETVRAEGLIENDPLGDFYVPVWCDMSSAGNVGSADTDIFCDTDGAYKDGGKILIWGDRSNYVLADIYQVTPGYVTLTAAVGVNITGAIAVPVRLGYSVEGFQQSRSFADDVDGEIQFELRDTDETAVNPFTTYLTLPVYTDTSVNFSPLSGSVFQANEVLTDGIGVDSVRSIRSILENMYSINVFYETLAERRQFRQFLNFLRGRDGLFWLPRRSRDLVAQAPIGASDVVITIAPVYPALSMYAGKHICINGTIFREITGAADNSGLVDISITALGIPLTDPEISLMRKYRLESENVEISHEGIRSTAQLIVREVQ